MHIANLDDVKAISRSSLALNTHRSVFFIFTHWKAVEKESWIRLCTRIDVIQLHLLQCCSRCAPPQPSGYDKLVCFPQRSTITLGDANAMMAPITKSTMSRIARCTICPFSVQVIRDYLDIISITVSSKLMRLCNEVRDDERQIA